MIFLALPFVFVTFVIQFPAGLLIYWITTNLWTIVQQFANAKRNGQTPVLRVALFEYGNTRLPASEGFIRQVVALTDDLDKLSECLFGLTTNGGDEYCGQVIDEAITRLDWSKENGGYKAISSKENPYGKIDELVYTQLTSDHPIDLCRYQVANCYMGRAGLINSGGESKGQKDLAEAVNTAVVNKRAGGTGLISGRKAFQKPFKDGAALLNAVQDVYLCKDVTIA